MLRDQMHDLTTDTQHKQTPAPIKLEPSAPRKAIHYEHPKPILQFFEEDDPIKKQMREKEMMSLTVRSITTPATSVAGGFLSKHKAKGKPMDIGMPPLTSDSGSF